MVIIWKTAASKQFDGGKVVDVLRWKVIVHEDSVINGKRPEVLLVSSHLGPI